MFKTLRYKNRKLNTITQLSLSRLILALGFAGIDVIWSLHLKLFGIENSTIGFISAILIIISLLTSFLSTPILEKISEFKILITSLIFTAIFYIFIYYFQNLYIFIIFSALIIISNLLRVESFDILFKDQANPKNLSEEEGFLYTLLNIGWLIGPLIAGYIMTKYGLINVYLSSSLFLIIGIFSLSFIKLKPIKKKREKIDFNIYQNIFDFCQKKNLRISYLIGCGIEIWYALIYIYVPLFIIKNNLGYDTVSIFLASIVFPLVFFEYKIGKLADKFGFKKFMVFGFFLLFIISLIVFFSNNIILSLVLLVLAHIPMSALEPLQDSFFFKQVKSKDEEKFYPIFATSAEIGGFVGRICIAILLLFFSDKYSYLLIAFFMLICSYFCTKIKEKNIN